MKSLLPLFVLFHGAFSFASLTYEQQSHIRRVNAIRAQHGLTPLCASQKLMVAAQSHSQDMRNHDYFAHRPKGTLPGGGWRGENIAAGQDTVADVMDAWMHSEGHRKNILGKNFKYIGVGHASGGDAKYDDYWTQNFSSLE